MWVCTRHPSAQLTAFPAFSSTGGTGKCHYLFRGQVFGFHASMMRLRNAERWSIVNELGIKSMSFLRRPLDPSPCHSLTPEIGAFHESKRQCEGGTGSDACQERHFRIWARPRRE
jgi:hypothetical protein